MSEHVDEPVEPSTAPAAGEPGTEHLGDEPPPASEPGTEHAGDEPGGEEESPTAGADFDLEAFVKALPEGVGLCPVCLGMGGVVEEPPYDPHTHACVTCEGRGTVRTGSLKSSEAERDCTDCGGRGWKPNDPHELPAGPARAVDFVGAEPTDYMGRTPDHPEFDWSRVARRVEVAEPVEVEA